MNERKVFGRSRSLRQAQTHYCPGCGHGVIHRLVAEVIDELGIRESVIGITTIGCAVVAYDYWDFDCVESPHGRGLAVASAVKRVRPKNIVFTYQGDGDLAAIGAGETIHAANRGENVTVVFVNNSVYGMTGGQMAPTTLIGQRTATTPRGRSVQAEGYPLKISELIAGLSGASYVERCSCDCPKGILKTKGAIKAGFLNQIEGKGFSLIEILSACPTYWNLSPLESMEWMKNSLMKEFPLGRLK